MGTYGKAAAWCRSEVGFTMVFHGNDQVGAISPMETRKVVRKMPLKSSRAAGLFSDTEALHQIETQVAEHRKASILHNSSTK